MSEETPLHKNGISPSIDVKLVKREPNDRIFVNRGLHLDSIKFYGFDMDYTLAVYKSPEYESMSFELLKNRLVVIGYPDDIQQFQYDPSFPVRGLWFDKLYGNLLKVDSHGNILVCVHGFRFLSSHEVSELYPNKYIKLDESRLYVLNTLFNIPETYMLACIVNYFEEKSDYSKTKHGVSGGNIHMSFRSIFQDVRGATDWLHIHGDLKSETLKNLDKYVHRDENLPILLNRIRSSGAKAVLITNSGYHYTNKIMTYLTNFPHLDGDRHWSSFWDCVVVDAKKPLFFEDGTILRKVNLETGSLSLGHHVGPLKEGEIYSGGSCEVISGLLGARGKDVLYIGDHIFGDILKSKKIRGWRTFLVIPELTTELQVWTSKQKLFENITRYECELSDVYRQKDSSDFEKPDTSQISSSLMKVVHDLDMSYGILGSLFRSGSRQTFFASQVTRYADIYASSYVHLMNYPLCYPFRAPPILMPHEATVDHYSVLDPEPQGFVSRSRRSSIEGISESPHTKRRRGNDIMRHLRAETPLKVVQVHDDARIDSDDESSNSPYANSSSSPDDYSATASEMKTSQTVS